MANADSEITMFLTLTGERVIISPDPRGNMRAWAIISNTLVFPAL